MNRFYTLIVILLALGSWIHPVKAQDASTWMPDANLRTAVRSALSLGNNDELTQAGMANLTALTAKNALISTLTGLEHATSLTRLDLRDNTISSISALSELTSLESLRLKGNDISSVSALSGLTNLTLLNLKDNNISNISGLSGLTNLEHLRVDLNSITDVQPLTSLVNLEKLWIAGNSLTNAHLLSSLTRLTQIDITIPDPPDTTAPGVSISVPSDTQTGAINATITFTETVSGFTQSDVSLSGSAASITSWSANSDNTVYTTTITPTASGTVTIGVAANVATDAANNQNTAATSKNVTVSVDTTAPGVSIAVPSGTQNGAFSVTITFTETVSGFVQSDVSLSGSAASITSWSANSDDTVYTATITPAASGTVTIGVAANVATDAANNENTAATSTSVTVSVDTTAPGVTVSVPSGTQNGAFNATMTFTETVSGFVGSDVSLSGSAASITSWSANSDDTVYTATITPTASGTVTIGVAANVATDAANNHNTAATSQTVTVNIPAPIPDPATWMLDANLRTAVRSALSLGNNDELTQAGMANLTALTAKNALISTLTGLEHATSLTRLDLRDNTISSISALSELTSLESLRLKGNDISSVSALSGLTNLTLLNLKDNNISNISGLSGLTNLEHLRVDLNSITDVQPLTSLVNLEKLWIAGNSLTNAHLLSSLTRLTQIDITIPDPPDTTAPGVSISVPSDTQTGAINATITFTETVSGFTQSDVSLSGSAASITSWSANSDNTVYTTTITPTASGTVTIGVAANVATDAANNPNTAATSKNITVSVDTTAPGVTVSVPSGTQNGAFDATITFTETVSGFVGSDVSLSGSAASITSWSANSDDTVYTATITPTASGTVTIGVAANVATDAANNQNTAATSQTVTVDVDKPSVTIGVPSGTQTGAFNATITFTETVSGFVHSEVSLSGSAASITSWSANSDNTVYTATITPTASGTVTIGVAANVATDAANNPNTAATSKNITVSVDTTAPGVSISVPSGTQNGAFSVTITFTETVSGFVGSDVSLSGSAASITSWSANSDDTVYTATLTPTASGTVTIGVAANVATDAANNQNTAATSKTATVDIDKPTVTIGVPSGTQTGAFDATITFTETVSDFVQSDVSLSGSAASITSWSANSDDTVYTATITPTASGTVTIGVAADVATDAANNQNTAATSKTVTVSVDTTAPGVSISVPSGTQNGAFSVTITFTETVSGFVGSDVSLSGSAASITWWSANSDDTVYTATITPTASGTVTIGVAANVATDAANNQNTAATSQTATVDIDKPTVTIGVPSGTQTGAFDATITFSETVSGFVQSEVSLSGSAASITSWSANSDDTVYTATLTPTASGTVTIGVAANVASDAANNQNTAATSKTAIVDIDKPTVTIGVPSGTQTGAFDATITFTETVSDFVQSDVSLSGSAASITSWSANSDDTVYTATITPTASGTVTIGVAANVATDAANNQNTAATSKTVTVSVDTTAPGVSITVPSEAQRGAFDATITFTETVSGFVGSDVSLSGSAASITSWSANSDDTVYTATITPTASGTMTVSAAANVATDAANNQNTAATSQTVTVDVDAPGVSLAVPSGTQTGAFDATITFTETVSGFVQSEVSLTGSAASITSWSANSDDTVYTATITPTASGTVTIGVAANVATDAANNQNTAAPSKNVTVNIPAPIPDPATWMPDANLRTAVRSALGVASDANFSKDDLSTLTTFRAVQSQIADLTGLEHAINLTDLNLEGNSITNIIPIKGLDNLIYLNLSHNQLGEVSSSNGLWIHHHHWPNLQELDLSHNQIYCIGYSIFSDHDGSIYADPLPSLTHLDVSYNRWLADALFAWFSPVRTSPGINRLQNLTHLDIRYTDINRMPTILYDYSTGRTLTYSRLEWLRVEGTTFFELYKLREIRRRELTLYPYLIDTIDIDVEVPEGPYHSEVPLYPTAPEQEKWMPDLPLRTVIREKLGLSDGEFLTQTKILELTELEVSDQDIYTTEGLEHATNLTSLDLSGTAQFTDYSSWDILKGIYRLPNLETLKLSDPQYTSSYSSPSTMNLAYTSKSCSLSHAMTQIIMGYSTRCYPGNERIEHFPSLKHLEIKNWKIVDALWLLHLETLETLKISGAETYYRLESLNAHLTLETTDIDVEKVFSG